MLIRNLLSSPLPSFLLCHNNFWIYVIHLIIKSWYVLFNNLNLLKTLKQALYIIVVSWRTISNSISTTLCAWNLITHIGSRESYCFQYWVCNRFIFSISRFIKHAPDILLCAFLWHFKTIRQGFNLCHDDYMRVRTSNLCRVLGTVRGYFTLEYEFFSWGDLLKEGVT